MKKYILIVVLIALAIGGYVLYTNKKKKEDELLENPVVVDVVTEAPTEKAFDWFDMTTWY